MKILFRLTNFQIILGWANHANRCIYMSCDTWPDAHAEIQCTQKFEREPFQQIMLIVPKNSAERDKRFWIRTYGVKIDAIMLYIPILLNMYQIMQLLLNGCMAMPRFPNRGDVNENNSITFSCLRRLFPFLSVDLILSLFLSCWYHF